MNIETLNQQFAIPQHISFHPGSGNLIFAEMKTNEALARIALLGAHVTEFEPVGEEPVLWVSKRSYYKVGKSIRGGIPVCWPWFAVHPTDPEKPRHGLVRGALWAVKETCITDDGSPQIWLTICDNETTRVLWPHNFELDLVVTLGQELLVELIVHNTGEKPFTYTGALHTYFAVSDVSKIRIHGLEGCSYLDKVDNSAQKTQDGVVTIDAEVDRIYLDTTADCVIEDPGFNRRIRVAKTGSRTTVVWNPGSEKAQDIPDFLPHEYREMICVETTNASDDQITVPPGEHHTVSTTISVEKIAD